MIRTIVGKLRNRSACNKQNETARTANKSFYREGCPPGKILKVIDYKDHTNSLRSYALAVLCELSPITSARPELSVAIVVIAAASGAPSLGWNKRAATFFSTPISLARAPVRGQFV
jgi:hypothetical protein